MYEISLPDLRRCFTTSSYLADTIRVASEIEWQLAESNQAREEVYMKLGLHFNYFSFPGGPQGLGSMLAESTAAADEFGFDIIGVADHLWQHPYFGGPEREELECYTTLGFLAAYTRQARLMALVTAATFRSPGLLAKMVTTLDVLTQG